MKTNRALSSTLTSLFGLATVTFALGAGVSGCKKAEAKVSGVGDDLKAFIIQNCESNERYCQVCAYGGKPTIMAVGDVSDEGFKKDLQKIQSLVDNYAKQNLSAFALYGKIEGGKFTPVDDKDAVGKLAALRKELGLTYPVTVVPKALTDKEAKDYVPFTKAYEIKASRTVMVAKADNKITFAETMGKSDTQYDQLAEAVKKSL